jgi:hypothetical protein
VGEGKRGRGEEVRSEEKYSKRFLDNFFYKNYPSTPTAPFTSDA